METVIVENPDPAGPWGAKAIGEPTNELLAGAIANAVFNATGMGVTELPIKSEKVLLSLRGTPAKS
jgi:CO/xanthine dehydrogenase Mo-binding subunit